MKYVLDMTAEEITRAEWRYVADTLRKAQEEIARLGGGRQTWIGPAIDIATERGKEPA